MPLTLLQQMQQLEALQQRTQKYYSLFFSTQQQQQRNQFLDGSDAEFEQQCLFTSNNKSYVAPRQEQKQYSIYQSQVITTRDDVNISRIFQDIVLTDNPCRKLQPIKVQLVVQNGQTIEVDLQSHTNDEFSLSNFSSFNVNREDDGVIDFRHLLDCIQKTTGKTLSKQGIDRIILQITTQMSQMNKELQRNKQRTLTDGCDKLSCRDTSVFDISQVNHVFDTALNNKVFNRNKVDRQRVLQCSKDTSLLSANTSVYEQKRVLADCCQKQNLKVKPKEDKQNGTKINQKQTHHKQLRIIRKNNPRQLLMFYSDIRQVDQFCITNKIYGKEKEKVLKAVQTNKASLTLE